MYPQYISDALCLKTLILCSENSQNGEIYRCANNYSKIKFYDAGTLSTYMCYLKILGDVTSSYIDKIDKSYSLNQTISTTIPPRFIEVIVNTLEISFSNLFSSKYDGKIHFSIPHDLLSDNNVYAVIDGNKYEALRNKKEDSYQNIEFCSFDYDLTKIKYRKNIEIHFKSVKENLDNYVTFYVEKLDEDFYENAQKAYKRIGMDITNQNAQIAADFGKFIDDYDYKVDDEDAYIKDRKKHYKNRTDLTQVEKNASLSNDLTKHLRPDMEYISNSLLKVQENYYRIEKNILIDPYITKFDDDYFIVGISEVYNSNIGKTASFNNDYDIIWNKTK